MRSTSLVRPLFGLAFLAVLALSLGACAAPRMSVAEDLEGEVRGYMEGYRWQRFDDAAARVPPERREAFLDLAEELEDELCIDDYEIQRVKLRGNEAALVQVKYTWHLDSRGVVHDTVVEQKWRRKGKHWLLLVEERLRGEELPRGVARRKAGPRVRPRAEADL